MNDSYLALQNTLPEVFPGSSLTTPETELHMYSEVAEDDQPARAPIESGCEWTGTSVPNLHA